MHLKTVKSHIAILYLALLVSCNNTSTTQDNKQQQQPKVTQSEISQMRMSPKQYQYFKKQIDDENKLLKKIQAAETKITYTTYYNMKGAETQLMLHLEKNGTGNIKNLLTDEFYKISWTEKQHTIHIKPLVDTNKLPFTKLKRINYKTLMCQSDNKKNLKIFHGKLTDDDNLEILRLIENMPENIFLNSNKIHQTELNDF